MSRLEQLIPGASGINQLRGEPEATLEHAEAAAGLAHEKGFALYVAWTGVLRGWALGEREPRAELVASTRQGLGAARATGASLFTPYWLALLATIHGRLGQAEEGLVATAEAMTEMARSGERFWEAEFQRLKGQLLLQAHAGKEEQGRGLLSLGDRDRALTESQILGAPSRDQPGPAVGPSPGPGVPRPTTYSPRSTAGSPRARYRRPEGSESASRRAPLTTAPGWSRTSARHLQSPRASGIFRWISATRSCANSCSSPLSIRAVRARQR